MDICQEKLKSQPGEEFSPPGFLLSPFYLPLPRFS